MIGSRLFRQELLSALERIGLPLAGGLGGAYAGSEISRDPGMGAVGGGLWGAAAGFGARGLSRALARRLGAVLDDMRPDMPPARNAGALDPRYAEFVLGDGYVPPLAGAGPPSPAARRHRITRQRELDADYGEMRPTMGEVIEGGLRGDEDAVSRAVPSWWLPTRSDPSRGSEDTLFGGAPFDPQRMRRLAGLSSEQSPTRVSEPNADTSGTEAAFAARITKDPNDWRQAARLAAELGLSQKARDWLATPSHAQFVILRYAGAPSDEIARVTGYSNTDYLSTVARKGRAAGVPIPRKPSGPLSGKFLRGLEAMEREVAAGRVPPARELMAGRSELPTPGSFVTFMRYAREGRMGEEAQRRALALDKEIVRILGPDYRRAGTEGKRGPARHLADLEAVEQAILNKEAGSISAAFRQRGGRLQTFQWFLWAANKGQFGPAVKARVEQFNKRISEAIGPALRRRRKRKNIASALLPYLVTGGIGSAISTVASREAQRRAILDEMNS